MGRMHIPPHPGAVLQEWLAEVSVTQAAAELGVTRAYPLHQQPECKAANLSTHHEAETCSSWADHVSSLGGQKWGTLGGRRGPLIHWKTMTRTCRSERQ